jgi:protein-disulfide isomerase
MEPNKSLTIPIAIIIAGAIVAGAILLTQLSPKLGGLSNRNESKTQDLLPPVTDKDYIYGNPNAPIMVIEYSDPSCPYCKLYHTTMTSLMKDYAKDGKVAWVYRHYPLNKPMANGAILHPNSGNESHAIECAGSLGGSDKFYEYAKLLYETTPSVTSQSPNGLDQTLLPKMATQIGLNENDFNQCMTSGKFTKKIEDEFNTGTLAGVTGTPYTFVITKTGKKIPVEGADMKSLKTAIDALLATDAN